MGDIIVTGGTGFVGRNLMPELIKIFPKENVLCLIKDQVDELEIIGRKVLYELKIKPKSAT